MVNPAATSRKSWTGFRQTEECLADQVREALRFKPNQLAGATCGIGVNTTNTVIATAGDGEPSCYVP